MLLKKGPEKVEKVNPHQKLCPLKERMDLGGQLAIFINSSLPILLPKLFDIYYVKNIILSKILCLSLQIRYHSDIVNFLKQEIICKKSHRY